MKVNTILRVVFVVFIFAGFIIAQEQETKIDLPRLTPEQKYDRLEWFQTNAAVLGIAFAKSQRLTVKDWAKHTVAFWAPSWSANRVSPIRFIRAMYRNASLDNNFKMEIASASETEVKGRMTVNGMNVFAGKMYNGISLKEYMHSGEIWRSETLKRLWDEDSAKQIGLHVMVLGSSPFTGPPRSH
jgi:hypothetical protein